MEQLFECFEGAAKFAEEVAGKHLNRAGPEGCIPECFDGHYRVKHDPGLHFPVNSWDALTAAPFRRAPPQSAEETWPRFFIAVRISSRDSVCFDPLFGRSGARRRPRGGAFALHHAAERDAGTAGAIQPQASRGR